MLLEALRRLSGALPATLALVPFAAAQRSMDAETAFHKAYYLEMEEGDLEQARALYQAIADTNGVPAALRERARARGRSVGEELACSDFTALVPEETLLYVEFNRPGEQLGSLLEQLGLTGEGADFGQGRLSISPTLLDAALGVRGAALAITNVDPTQGAPGGVLILHPGDVELVRGLIETALPASGAEVDPIAGHPTFHVQGQAYVTLSDRVVVAGTDKAEIADVFRRMAGDRDDSLGANPDLARAMEMRGDDLMYFCVNAEPVLPMVMGLASAAAQEEPELAAMLPMIDLESLRTLSGRVGVTDDGLSLDVALELAEGHRNVVFNLLRMPHIDRETLGLVPRGVAAFAAGALNEYHPVDSAEANPPVAAMDLGREVFGNLAQVSLFTLPSTQRIGREVIPDMALAMRVNDPARSLALWRLGLEVAAAGSGSTAGTRTVTVAGHEALRFELEGVPVYLVAHGHSLYVTPSERALEASIAAAHDGASVLEDPAFEAVLADLGDGDTSAVAAHVGRCLQMALPMMSDRERREVSMVAQLLEHSTVALRCRHDDTRMAFSAEFRGIPDVSGLVGQMIAQEMGGGLAPGAFGVVEARRAAAEVAAARVERAALARRTEEDAWREAAVHEAMDQAVVAEHLREAFDQLVAEDRVDDARQVLEPLGEALEDDAFQLNNLAWALLTEEAYGGSFDDEARALSLRSNELSQWGNWYYLDTYAHALHAGGMLEQAVSVQEKAVAAAEGDPRQGEAAKALKRFRQELKGQGEPVDTGQR